MDAPSAENAEKRGKKRPADGKGGQEEHAEEEEHSEDEEHSEEDSGEEDEEEEEEDGDEESYHDLCKKPAAAPLQEPRMGLCYWSDAVPAEVGLVLVLPGILVWKMVMEKNFFFF